MHCDVKNTSVYLPAVVIASSYLVSSVNLELIDDSSLKYTFFIDARRNLCYLFSKYLSIYYKSRIPNGLLKINTRFVIICFFHTSTPSNLFEQNTALYFTFYVFMQQHTRKYELINSLFFLQWALSK